MPRHQAPLFLLPNLKSVYLRNLFPDDETMETLFGCTPELISLEHLFIEGACAVDVENDISSIC
jgi:hypothetical protein